MAKRKARKKSRSRSARLSLRSALYGTALIGLGFCIGIVAGSLLDAPRLWLDWIRGPVQTVDLARPADEEPPLEAFAELHRDEPPSVAAPAIQPEPPTTRPEREPARPVAPRPSPAPPETAAIMAELERDVGARGSSAPPTDVMAQLERNVRRRIAPPAGTLVVQVAAPEDRAEALAIVGRLRAAGFAPFMREPGDDGRHRVRVQPASGQAVRELAGLLEAQGFSTWITRE